MKKPGVINTEFLYIKEMCDEFWLYQFINWQSSLGLSYTLLEQPSPTVDGL